MTNYAAHARNFSRELAALKYIEPNICLQYNKYMKLISTYSIKIKDYNHIFKETISIYRAAVEFFINVCLLEWEFLSLIATTKEKLSCIEYLTLSTCAHPKVKYNFNSCFYKTPCYLRRAAINEAIGKVSSYLSNLAAWEASDPRTRGSRPSKPKTGFVFPVLYRGNMYKGDIFTGNTVQIKIFRNNTWDWLTVELKKTDIAYIRRHCKHMKMCSPTLMKRGKEWFLDFSFEEKTELTDTPIDEQIIVAVDLGINTACTCSVMAPDGTVLGRHFLKLSREYDCLKRKTDHIKRAQRHGSRSVPNLWAYARGVNKDIAVKTARYITDIATLYDADVIVMEHLDLNGKAKGSKKQRLKLWRAKYVQEMVAHKAHHDGRRISTVNAWGTSGLAFDGSGRVLRGSESGKTGGCYSVCEFQTGKVYNCDLNASYNIGARYFVREILKTLPATEAQRIGAKIPGCVKRSTCTLSTLINLNGELHPLGCMPAA